MQGEDNNNCPARRAIKLITTITTDILFCLGWFVCFVLLGDFLFLSFSFAIPPLLSVIYMRGLRREGNNISPDVQNNKLVMIETTCG